MARVLLLACLLALPGIAPVRADTARAVDHLAVFDALTRTVRERFYDPHFGGRDWDALDARYRARLAGVHDDAEFRALGQALLDELGVSHARLHAPGPSDQLGLAIITEALDGTPVVVDIDPASAARAAGLRIGDRILPSSTVRGPGASPATLDVVRCDGSPARLTVPRESAYWPPREPTLGWSVLRRGDGRSVGYLRADRFDDDAAAMIDTAMATLGRTDGLLIDVRRNSGGNASALRLLAYFGTPGPGIALLSREVLQALPGPVRAADLVNVHRVGGAHTTEAVFAAVGAGGGAVMLMVEDLGERRYAGPVVVLIGPETASAAEGFAWAVRDRSDAVLVGRPTAGALLSSERFELPGGWRVTLPVHGVWDPQGRDHGDRPVPPHVVTVQTRETVCRHEDVDLAAGVTALEAAWAERR